MAENGRKAVFMVKMAQQVRDLNSKLTYSNKYGNL